MQLEHIDRPSHFSLRPDSGNMVSIVCGAEVYLAQTSAECTGHRSSPWCSNDILVTVGRTIATVVCAAGLRNTAVQTFILSTGTKGAHRGRRRHSLSMGRRDGE